MRPSPHVAIILALAAAGCGYHNPPRGPAADFGAPAGRRCFASRMPARLPDVGDLVAVQALNAALAGAQTAPGTTVLTLRFDSQGRPIRNEVLVAGAGFATSLSVRDAVDRAVRAQQPGRPWGVRLLVTTGSSPRLRVERQEICPAVALDQHIVGSYTSADGASGARPPFGFRPDFDNSLGQPGYREAHARVYVTSQGRVGQAALADPGLLSAGNAGRALGPQGPLGWLYDVSFEPTLVDGLPTASWVDIWFYMPTSELDHILSYLDAQGGYGGSGYAGDGYAGYGNGYADNGGSYPDYGGGYAGYGGDGYGGYYGGYAGYGAAYDAGYDAGYGGYDIGYAADGDADDAGYSLGYSAFGDLPFGYAGWGYGGYGYGYGYGGFGYGSYGYGGYGYRGFGYGGFGYGGYGYRGYGPGTGYGYGFGAGPGGWTLFSLPLGHRPTKQSGTGTTGTGTGVSGQGSGTGQSGTGGGAKSGTVRVSLPLETMPGVRPHTRGTPLHPGAPQSRPAVARPWTVAPHTSRPAVQPHPVPRSPGIVIGSGGTTPLPWPRPAAPASASQPRPAPTTRAGTRTGPSARHPQAQPRVLPQPMPGTFQRWDHPRPAPELPRHAGARVSTPQVAPRSTPPVYRAPPSVYRPPPVHRSPPAVYHAPPVVRTSPRPAVHTARPAVVRHSAPRTAHHHGGHVHHEHPDR